MNTKKVKALRKRLGYHPRQERKYSFITKYKNRFPQVVLAADCLRSTYQKMKAAA